MCKQQRSMHGNERLEQIDSTSTALCDKVRVAAADTGPQSGQRVLQTPPPLSRLPARRVLVPDRGSKPLFTRQLTLINTNWYVLKLL